MPTHESGQHEPGLRPDICPECGHDQSARRLPRPLSLTHWSRSVPIIIVLIALTGFGIWLYATRQATGFSMGVPSLQLVEPGVTRDELNAIANGPYPQRIPLESLADAVKRLLDRPDAFAAGDPRIEFTFAEAQGKRIDFDFLGWPTPFYFTAGYPVYDDIVRRTGQRFSRTDESLAPLDAYEQPRDPLLIPPRPRWSWSWGGIAYQPPPEETGGVDTLTVIFPFAIAVPLAFAVALWWFVALVQVCAARIGWRKRDRRCWPARLIAALLVITLFTVIMFAERRTESMVNVSAGRIIQEPPGGPTQFMRYEDAVLTSITESELRTMLQDPSTFDARFAQRLLESVSTDEQSHGPDRFLAIGLRSESVIISGALADCGETFKLFEQRTCQFLRRPEMGESVRIAPPAGTMWKLASPDLIMTRSTGDPNALTVSTAVNLPNLALVVLAASLLLWFMFAVTRFARSHLAKRRRTRHQCIACGHYLSAPLPR